MVRLRRRELLLAGLGLLVGGCTLRGSAAYGHLNTPGCRHTIRAGDTLARIAGDYGSSVLDILRYNDLPDGDLPPGQVIFIPNGRPPFRRHVRPQQRSYVLVKRRAWDARAPGPNHDPMLGIHAITLHHTCEYDGMRHHSDLEAVQTICGIHRDRHGWADIGYHYLIGRDGKVYEGRAATIQGAHCGGTNNRHNLGISLIGDFDARPPTGAQERTARLFIRAMQREYGIPVDRVYGHRDFNGSLTCTACPGEAGYRWLQAFRSAEARAIAKR